MLNIKKCIVFNLSVTRYFFSTKVYRETACCQFKLIVALGNAYEPPKMYFFRIFILLAFSRYIVCYRYFEKCTQNCLLLVPIYFKVDPPLKGTVSKNLRRFGSVLGWNLGEMLPPTPPRWHYSIIRRSNNQLWMNY